MTDSTTASGATAQALPQISALELDRRRYRRRNTGRSVLISLVSTVVVAVLIWQFLVNSPGWEVTRQTFFSPEYFMAALPLVWDGLLLNMRVLVYAVAGLMFVAFSWPFIRFTDWLTARQQAREQIGGLV